MASLKKNLPSTGVRKNGQCFECKKTSTLVCGKCRAAHYCSRDCQRSNWRIHKVFCRMKTIPSDLDPEKSVQVILLPGDGSDPSFIRIPRKKCVDEEFPGIQYEKIDTNMFFQTQGSIYSRFFPAAKQRALQRSYEIVYKDDFLIDGHSTANLCIGRLLLNKRHTEHWRGNVLLCNARPEHRGTGSDYDVFYEDMTMSDVKDAVEFLQDYTQQKYGE